MAQLKKKTQTGVALSNVPPKACQGCGEKYTLLEPGIENFYNGKAIQCPCGFVVQYSSVDSLFRTSKKHGDLAKGFIE